VALFAVAVLAVPLSASDRGQISIEYVAHACFRIISPSGDKVLIDPYQSRWWLGYDFPHGPVVVDAVLASHPHPDHDAGWASGEAPPWDDSTPLLRTPGSYQVGTIKIQGVAGKHAEPYGKEFGQTNTIWVLEVAGLRIVHIGDNGPITPKIAEQIGQVDILMLPIDSEYHILKHDEIEAWRAQLTPRLLIPMHYRHPKLETEADSPSDLGNIDGWLESEQYVRRLTDHRFRVSSLTLPDEPLVLVFQHSATR
jgi:L-ascorbate metabolism protein UlaG (beta-lactamase superfamily)